LRNWFLSLLFIDESLQFVDHRLLWLWIILSLAADYHIKTKLITMQSLNLPTHADKSVQRASGFIVLNIFRRDYEHYEGVPRINIYLLRLLFTLMFLFLTYDAWSHILTHKGPWDNANAAAWCMWGSYSVISFIGVIRPLKMLPIVLFEVIYKVAWLAVVAYPLWVKNELAGSPAEGMARVFIWVILPIAAMPWRYFFRKYILGKQTV
jgi:hypothetical protein